MAFELAPADEAFIAQAKSKVSVSVDIARPAQDVWSELTGDNPMASYCRIISRIDWTSPRPFGVGTTRRVRVLGGLFVIDESYVRWEEGRRKSFIGVRMNLPLIRRFAEDYVVEPIGEDRSRFTWTAAWEPTALGRPMASVTRALFASLVPDIRRHFTSA
ncbi:MAG TPA: SRPBCC family protein [Aeromicrobium sp.]|nr:SRPBCC family protein [Aeromicrobium sp.]